MNTRKFRPNAHLGLLAGLVVLASIVYSLNAGLHSSEAATRPGAPSMPADCPAPPAPATPEPLWVDPVTSPTTLLTQTLGVTLGGGRAITITSEAGTLSNTSPIITAPYSSFSTTIPLLPNTIHHLSVEGLVEYESGCFYTLSTSSDRNGLPLTIAQFSPTLYLPIVRRDTGGPTLAGCSVFPADNAWNRDISNDPVDPLSANYIASINSTRQYLHADFGSNLDWGIPYTVVPGTQPMVPITFVDYGDESDPGPYPIPPNAPVEAGSDHHVLVLNSGTCKLYELYGASKNTNDAGWSASSGAVFDLTSNALRPDGWTSADAAGLPILPGLVRYDEVASGAIHHAVRFTVDSSQRAYIHPATHFASSDSNPNLPPMGLRLRLKAGYNISSYTGQARVILEALKKYGMIVADNGSSWFISGATDSRWNDDDLDQLKRVPGSAFEAVQSGPLIRP